MVYFNITMITTEVFMNWNSTFFRFYYYAAFYFRKRAVVAVLIP